MGLSLNTTRNVLVWVSLLRRLTFIPTTLPFLLLTYVAGLPVCTSTAVHFLDFELFLATQNVLCLMLHLLPRFLPTIQPCQTQAQS